MAINNMKFKKVSDLNPKKSKYFSSQSTSKNKKRKLNKSAMPSSSRIKDSDSLKKKSRNESRAILKSIIVKTFSQSTNNSNDNNNDCSDTDTYESTDSNKNNLMKSSTENINETNCNDGNSIKSQNSDIITSNDALTKSKEKINDALNDENSIMSQDSDSIPSPVFSRSRKTIKSTQKMDDELVSLYITEEKNKLLLSATANGDKEKSKSSANEEDDEKSIMIYSDSSVVDLNETSADNKDGEVSDKLNSSFDKNDENGLLSNKSNNDKSGSKDKEKEFDSNTIPMETIDLSNSNGSPNKIESKCSITTRNDDESFPIYSELTFSRVRKSADGKQTKTIKIGMKRNATKTKPRNARKKELSSTSDIENMRTAVTKPRQRKNTVRNEPDLAIKILTPIRTRPSSCALCASCPCNGISITRDIENAPSLLSQNSHEIEMALLARLARLEKHVAWYQNLYNKANRELKKFRSKVLKLQAEQLEKQILKDRDERPRFLPDPEFEEGQGECLNGDVDKDTDQVIEATAIVFGETAASKLHQATLTQIYKPRKEENEIEGCVDIETAEVTNDLWGASSLKCDIEPLLSKHKLDSENVQDILDALNKETRKENEEEDDENDIQPLVNDDNFEVDDCPDEMATSNTKDSDSSSVSQNDQRNTDKIDFDDNVVENRKEDKLVTNDTKSNNLEASMHDGKEHLSKNTDDDVQGNETDENIDHNIHYSETPLTLTMSVKLGTNSFGNNLQSSHSQVDLNTSESKGQDETLSSIKDNTTTKKPRIECNSYECNNLDKTNENESGQVCFSNLLHDFDKENDGTPKVDDSSDFKQLPTPSSVDRFQTNTGQNYISKCHALNSPYSIDEDSLESNQDITIDDGEDAGGLNHLIDLFNNEVD